jgi:cytochrome c peroxidase
MRRWLNVLRGTLKEGQGRIAVTLVALLCLALNRCAITGQPAQPSPSAAGLDPEAVRGAALAAGLSSLDTVPIPLVNNLTDFLKPGPAARTAAVQLGKAFFWDMQTGSDGQACASCHFHAGADNRVRNQLNPGLKASAPDTRFGNNFRGVPGFPQFQPDYTLAAANFPFHKLAAPDESNFLNRRVLRDTNDVASSMGVFAAEFTEVAVDDSAAEGFPFVDPIFNLGAPSANLVDKNVRRAEPRNTPSVINAVFNYSNFWDGRAHNLFNGVSVIGPLDPNARIWLVTPNGTLVQTVVRIPNSSLASQAVGPPTNETEMSYLNRPFPMVGRKLLSLTPLGLQAVDPTDSVLGPISRFPQTGLTTSYASLIQAAFQDKYWNSTTLTPDGYTLMEANFTLFWGLAIQMYETTLVSDESPFDRFMAGENAALSQEQLQGLLIFLNQGVKGNLPEVDAAIEQAEAALGGAVRPGNCISCHGGPEFTDAAFTSLAEDGKPGLIEIEDSARLVGGFVALDASVPGLLDNGFSNIGVRPTHDDLGRGGRENDFPLSFTRQALDPAFNFLLQDVAGAKLPCNPSGPQANCRVRVQVDGAFKIPGLRNVELTGPYFHNGGQATLAQVVEFYDRQSDFGDVNIEFLEGDMVFIHLDRADVEPLVEFLLTLTDERVRLEQAPFDHPQLLVPNGGTFANERPFIEVPAVGAGGRPAAGLPPLNTFLSLDPR